MLSPQALLRRCSLVLDNLRRTKQMRGTSERSQAMSCRRSACTSHTKPGTPTRPLKSLSSQFLRRSLLSYSWLQTSWTAETLLVFSTSTLGGSSGPYPLTKSEQKSPNFQLCNQDVDLEIFLLPFQARLHLSFDPVLINC